MKLLLAVLGPILSCCSSQAQAPTLAPESPAYEMSKMHHFRYKRYHHNPDETTPLNADVLDKLDDLQDAINAAQDTASGKK